jgi:putative aldouronate transport system permease protein
MVSQTAAATAKPPKVKKLHKMNHISIGDIIIWIIMIFCIVIVLYPILSIVSGSFSNSELVLRGQVGILPKGFTTRNYIALFSNKKLWPAYAYTLLYTVVGTAFSLFLNFCCAYPLSKRTFVGRRVWNFLLMFTMLFSGGLIPSFLLNTQVLPWMDTIWPFTLSGCVGAWTVIMIRTYFESIPSSLEESAKIDGANDVIILFKIYLPLSMPILATFGLFAAVGQWNNYFGPMLYMHDPSKWPVALLLRQWLFVDEGTGASGVGGSEQAYAIPQVARNYTAIVVTMLPIICVYPFIQKYFVKGMMVGAIKG